MLLYIPPVLGSQPQVSCVNGGRHRHAGCGTLLSDLPVPVFHPVLWAFHLFWTLAVSPRLNMLVLSSSTLEAEPPSKCRQGPLQQALPALAQVQLVPRSHEGVSGLCLTGKMATSSRVSFETAGSPSLLPEMGSQVTGSDVSDQADLLWSFPPYQQVFPSHPCPVSPC